MDCFFPLIESFHTQDEPAYCGLGTLVTVLNALKIDPHRQWKGVWRYWNESLLECCEPLEVIQKKGIVFTKLGCLVGSFCLQFGFFITKRGGVSAGEDIKRQ